MTFMQALVMCKDPTEAYVRIIGSEAHSDAQKDNLIQWWFKQNGWYEVPARETVPPGFKVAIVEI